MAGAGLPRQDRVLRRPTGERPLAEVVALGEHPACASERGEAWLRPPCALGRSRRPRQGGLSGVPDGAAEACGPVAWGVCGRRLLLFPSHGGGGNRCAQADR